MRSISLNGEWKLDWCNFGIGEKQKRFLCDYKSKDIIEATVPGDVHLDLMKADIIDEPLYDMNSFKYKWIEDREFWYRKEFEIPFDFISVVTNFI